MRKTKTKEKSIVYGPVYEDRTRYVENASKGLRLVGFADKITHLNHKGWYIDDDERGCDVMRGVVYQLPARRGKKRFVYGYADPYDDGAVLCFDVVEDASRAAHLADDFAERSAERERAWRRASDARHEYENLKTEIQEARERVLSLGRELRRLARDGVSVPSLREAARGKMGALYHRIQNARKRRAELLADFGRSDGWASY